MMSFVRKFFTDETAFVGGIRATCLGLGGAVSSGIMDVQALHLPKSAGILLMALGGFIRAGEKNPKLDA